MYDKDRPEVAEGARWGPEEAAWRAAGHLVTWGVGERAVLVRLPGYAPVALVPGQFRHGEPVARDAIFGVLRGRMLADAARAALAHDHAFKDVETRFRHWRRWESWK